MLKNKSLNTMSATPANAKAAAPALSSKAGTRLRADLELQAGSGWARVSATLHDTKIELLSSSSGKSEYVVFGPETRVQIPMRNLRENPRFKGCALQVETASRMFTFMARSLREKNEWARAVNLKLSQLKRTQEWELPLERVASGDDDEQDEENFFVRQAQSVRPKRTVSRAPQAHFSTPQKARSVSLAPTADRSRHIEALESELKRKQQELVTMEGRLRKEEAYRDQITQGVKRWREDFTRNREQKLQDTQERLTQEAESNRKLRAKQTGMQRELQESSVRIEELEMVNERLTERAQRMDELEEEMAQLRDTLEKEMAFGAILEQDTRALSEKLTQVIHSNDALQEEISEKDRENLELREEVGKLTLENRRLQEQQKHMHREFFFSMAISIKLSLAQQGIYSNANLNEIYEQVLAVDYRDWHDWVTDKLAETQLKARSEAEVRSEARASTPSKRKGGFFSNLFDKK